MKKALTLIALAYLGWTGISAAQVNFSTYVALGDSLTAGYASGGLAKFYQDHSYPAILARQFGIATFQQPIVSDPGIQPVLKLQRLLDPQTRQLVPVLAPSGTTPGQPTNATFSGIYNNLGIPGAKTGDLLTRTGNINKLLSGNVDPNTVMYDIVLRFPKIPGTNTDGTALEQAIAARPTFLTVWIGNNDILGAALSAVALEGVTMTPVATFQQQYRSLLSTLRTRLSTTTIVVANIPKVTAIPFVTTVKPYVFNAQGQKVYLQADTGPLTDADYVTLQASSLISQGYGIPGTGRPPLPDGGIVGGQFVQGVVLRAAEVATINNRIAQLNSIIAQEAAAVGAPVLDVNALFDGIVRDGYMLGGVKLTPAFLTGGIFSYDGVHPQRLGYAIVANEFVKLINAKFGARVPQVNLQRYLEGTETTTTVMASEVQFAPTAFESLLQVFAPQPSEPLRQVVRRPSRQGLPTEGRPQRP
ncbi:MAG: SGNH/GDSL hydrolase family protein [Thermoanaerobaculum sp.]|nr:SGNH/GDSL hydrolase family protein [Thermoanaerobaculum sp.]MDW7968519.1 SGNH/GDSL hydrolase family protein [Thermoanaerobaculum sp.]